MSKPTKRQLHTFFLEEVAVAARELLDSVDETTENVRNPYIVVKLDSDSLYALRWMLKELKGTLP